MLWSVSVAKPDKSEFERVMLMLGLLNLGSFALGLIAWILPAVNLTRHNKSVHGNWFVFSIASVSTCAISLCLQILYISHKVNIGDWSALLDSMRAVVIGSLTLLAITIILNVINWVKYHAKS
jgi:cytochrome c oxidase subunit 4